MDVTIALGAALAAYLLGSISFARVVVRLVAPKIDIVDTKIAIPGSDEQIDMYAVGATSVSLQLGAKYGGLTTLLDMLKVALPVLAFRLAFPENVYHLIAAVMGLVGHNWPLYHRFKGGRGLSAVYGGFLVLDPIGVLVTSVGGMALGLLVLRSVIVAYLAGLWLMIPWFWFRTHDLAYLGYAVAVNLLFSLSMIPDIKGHLERKRRGIELDPVAAMELTPMGHHMNRLARRLGLMKDKR